MTEVKEDQPLVKMLHELKRKEDRAALAALRSGVGKAPGEAPRMFPFVSRFLPDGISVGPRVQAVFITASLFAKHPDSGGSGTLGHALRTATSKHGEEGVTSRLTAALDADPEDLSHHLTGLVSLCESAGVPINWNQFLWDVRDLLGDDEDRRNRTRLQWAKGFWSNPTTTNSDLKTEKTQS
jgi:CRISPR system Cascade subunit CasB